VAGSVHKKNIRSLTTEVIGGELTDSCFKELRFAYLHFYQPVSDLITRDNTFGG